MTHLQTEFDFNGERSFYNTIGAEGQQLKKYADKARSQEDIVFNYYRRVKRATALQAIRDLKMNHDSCKRAISNLKKRGMLVKTEDKVIEQFGKMNFIYAFVK